MVKRNGSTVSSKATQFWYDGFNQLQRVKDPDGQFIEYTYNGKGLRTKKDLGDNATNYLYDSNANIIMETDQGNAVTAKNIRGLKLIYRESYANSITDPTYLYYLHNAHGDVTQLLNEKEEVIKDYRYDPFGEEQSAESLAFGGKQSTELWRQEIEKIDNPFRYCGEYQDEETGNYYLRARYYDPSTQRFTQEDSYGVEKGAAWLEHLWGYGNNNPLRFIDPTGHRVEGDGKVIISGPNGNKTHKTNAAPSLPSDKQKKDASEKAKKEKKKKNTKTATPKVETKATATKSNQAPTSEATEGTGEVKKPTNTTTTTPKVTPAPPPKKIKTIEQVVDENDLSWVTHSQAGRTALKQTAGAVVFGGTVIVTAGGASMYYTAGGSIMYIGNYSADVLGPPPPGGLVPAIGGKGLEWVGVDPLGDLLFGNPNKKK